MVTPTGPDLCYALAARKKARYLSRFYDGKLAPCGLSISQFSILSLLRAHGSLKLAKLAELLVMERTSLVRALKPLQTSGWVVTERPVGERSFELRLLPAGLQKVGEAAPLWFEAQAAFEAQVGRDSAVRLRNQILELKLAG
ncbi:MAG: transcriptional regulator [Rhizobacter sp.]|nr:transcriptional regulator [Rhizobacter sp.]